MFETNQLPLTVCETDNFLSQVKRLANHGVKAIWVEVFGKGYLFGFLFKDEIEGVH